MNLKAISRPVLPIYILNWIFGIGIIEYPLGTPHPYISLVYSSITIISYFTLATIAYPSIISMTVVALIDTPIKILFFSNIFLTFSIIFLGWYRGEMIRNCLIRAALTDNLLEHIGVPKDYIAMLRISVGKAIPIFLFNVAIIFLTSLLLFETDKPWVVSIMNAAVLCYPVLIMFMSDSMFVKFVRNTSSKFVRLNQLLKSMSTTTRDCPRHKTMIQLTSDLKESSSCIINNVTKNPTVVIRLSKEIHLELVQVCQDVGNAYGLQVLLSILVAFAVITGNLYNCFVLLVDSHLAYSIVYKSAATSMTWIIYHTLKITLFSLVCDSCVQNSTKTGDIINELYDEPSLGKETQITIREFNTQLIERRLHFTAFKLFTIDLALIRVMISTITTYLMIMIQLKNIDHSEDIHKEMHSS